MAKSISKGDWRQAGSHLLSAGGNALFAIPAVGTAGKTLGMAGRGARLMRTGGQLGRMAKGTGRMAAMARGYRNAAHGVNLAGRAAANSSAGKYIFNPKGLPANIYRKIPHWVTGVGGKPGWKNELGRTGKFIGASMGMGMGSEMLNTDPAHASPGVDPATFLYPAGVAIRNQAYAPRTGGSYVPMGQRAQNFMRNTGQRAQNFMHNMGPTHASRYSIR